MQTWIKRGEDLGRICAQSSVDLSLLIWGQFPRIGINPSIPLVTGGLLTVEGTQLDPGQTSICPFASEVP